MKTLLGALTTIALLSFSTEVFANGVYVEFTGTPKYTKSDRRTGGTLGGSFDGVTVNPAAGTGYDFRGTLGYYFGTTLLLGVNYNISNEPLKADPVQGGADGLDQYDKTNEIGPVLGFLWKGFHLHGTYFLGGKRKSHIKYIPADPATPTMVDFTLEQKLAKGYQLNLGYSAKLSSKMGLGVSLVYKNVSYKSESRTDDVDGTQNYTDKVFSSRPVEVSLTPLLSISFMF